MELAVGEPRVSDTGRAIRVERFGLEVNGAPLLSMSAREGGLLGLDRLHYRHPAFREILRAVLMTASSTIHEDVLDALVPGIKARSSGLFPRIEEESEHGDASRPVSGGQGRQDLPRVARLLVPGALRDLVGGIGAALENEIGRLRYVGPLRWYPSDPSRHRDSNGAEGGCPWDVVRTDGEVRRRVNEWLGDPDRLKTPCEFEVRGRPPVSNLSLIDKRAGIPVGHQDIGIGVSQMLSLLVTAYGSEEKLLAIEQPETHMHPALQAELGDIFLESALGEGRNTFLIETHSEHLLLRILRRMRETAEGELPKDLPEVHSEQVSVLYVLPSRGDTEILHIPLTADGEFERLWPEGFFAERSKELF